MRTSALAIIAALAVVSSSTIASAQSVGVYVGPPAPYAAYEYDYYYTAPRFRPRAAERTIVVRPAGRCGTYRYWDGEACVDARNR